MDSHQHCHSSSACSLCCLSPENGHSPIHFYLDILLWGPATFYTDLQLVLIIFRKIPSDIWLLGCAQWIHSFPDPYSSVRVLWNKIVIRLILGCYLLEQGQRRRRYDSSFDNARTMNCSLNNNTNHDPITKSGFTIQPLQKHGLFHKIHMFCDSVVFMKIPPKSQKVSIINIDYVSSSKKYQYRDWVR